MFGFKKTKKSGATSATQQYERIIANAEKSLGNSKKIANGMSADASRFISFTNEMLVTRR